ncbi:MAG: stage III sporulation protein AF [Eubacteriales bacterium]|nr:stage III sporulation protein AF [Eubacteriales bacterium]
MLEYLSEWMKQIAYYMVLVTMVIQLTAGKSYQKYIRMFTGIVLVLFVLSPAAKFASVDFREIMDSVKNRYEQELREAEMNWRESIDQNQNGTDDNEDVSGTIEVEEIQIGQ